MLPCLCEIERWGEGRQKEREETGLNLMTGFAVPEKKKNIKDFPGDPVVEILRFHLTGHGFNPWSGN